MLEWQLLGGNGIEISESLREKKLSFKIRLIKNEAEATWSFLITDAKKESVPLKV